MTPKPRPCLQYPTGLRLRGEKLFICDYLNQAVRIFDLGTRVLETLVGDPRNTVDFRPGPLALAAPALPWKARAAVGRPADIAFMGPEACMLVTSAGVVRLDLSGLLRPQAAFSAGRNAAPAVERDPTQRLAPDTGSLTKLADWHAKYLRLKPALDGAVVLPKQVSTFQAQVAFMEALPGVLKAFQVGRRGPGHPPGGPGQPDRTEKPVPSPERPDLA